MEHAIPLQTKIGKSPDILCAYYSNKFVKKLSFIHFVFCYVLETCGPIQKDVCNKLPDGGTSKRIKTANYKSRHVMYRMAEVTFTAIQNAL